MIVRNLAQIALKYSTQKWNVDAHIFDKVSTDRRNDLMRVSSLTLTEDTESTELINLYYLNSPYVISVY